MFLFQIALSELCRVVQSVYAPLHTYILHFTLHIRSFRVVMFRGDCCFRLVSEWSCFTQFGSSEFGCAQRQDFDRHTQFVTEQMQISESLDWKVMIAVRRCIATLVMTSRRENKIL